MNHKRALFCRILLCIFKKKVKIRYTNTSNHFDNLVKAVQFEKGEEGKGSVIRIAYQERDVIESPQGMTGYKWRRHASTRNNRT